MSKTSTAAMHNTESIPATKMTKTNIIEIKITTNGHNNSPATKNTENDQNKHTVTRGCWLVISSESESLSLVSDLTLTKQFDLLSA